MKTFSALLFTLSILLAIACEKQEAKQGEERLNASNEVLPDVVDFNFHVKPILSAFNILAFDFLSFGKLLKSTGSP